MNPLRQTSPVGLHVGGRFFGAAQLTRRGSTTTLSNALVAPRVNPGRPIDGAEVRRIVTLLERRGFVGKAVSLAAPEEMIIASVLDLPPRASGAPVEQIAAAELGRIHKTDASTLTVGLWELPAPARRRDGLPTYAVACPVKEATDLATVFEDEGVEVLAMDARACALARACEPLIAPSPKITTIVDISFDATRVAVAVGATIAYERTIISSSLTRLIDSIVAAVEVDDELAQYIAFELGLTQRFEDERDNWELLADARKPVRAWFDLLTRELTLATAYVLERYEQEHPASVLLTGSGAAIAGLDGALTRRLSAPCRAVRCADLVTCPDRFTDIAGDTALATAIGLAMRFDR